MKLLEENKKALEANYPECMEKLQQVTTADHIHIYPAENGDKVIGIEKDQHLWYLNSRLDPDYAANVYADRYQTRIFGTYFIFGLSDGRHIRKILEKCDNTNQLIVYEPDIQLFYQACCQFPLKDLLESEKIIFYVPNLIGSIEKIVSKTVSYMNRTILEMCVLPGYDFLYREDYTKFEDEIIDGVKESVVTKNTKLAIGRKYPQYTLYHMKNIIYHSDCEQLRRKLAEYDLSHIPAIIVSAGPSLDKNINELKKAQGKAFIIVVDAALRSVIKAGIRPDMVYSVDYKAPDYFFEGIDLRGLIWMCERSSKPWILQQMDQKIFYSGYFCTYYSVLSLKTIGYALPVVFTGGSVSTNAFTLACYLGFQKIIFTGQDLAFTNGVSHTKGAIGAFGDNKNYIKSRYIVQVESADGELLDTDFQMWGYKHWFEKSIRALIGKVDVINATEGGANIEGAENRKLSDVIAQECTEQLDIYEIARNIPPAFTKEQQLEMAAELNRIRDYLTELRELTERSIEKQEHLLRLLEQNPAADIKQDLIEMTKDNDAIGTHVISELVALYTLKEEYESGESICVEEDMGTAELIENNRNLYKEYLKAMDLLEEDIEEYLLKG